MWEVDTNVTLASFHGVCSYRFAVTGLYTKLELNCISCLNTCMKIARNRLKRWCFSVFRSKFTEMQWKIFSYMLQWCTVCSVVMFVVCVRVIIRNNNICTLFFFHCVCKLHTHAPTFFFMRFSSPLLFLLLVVGGWVYADGINWIVFRLTLFEPKIGLGGGRGYIRDNLLMV